MIDARLVLLGTATLLALGCLAIAWSVSVLPPAVPAAAAAAMLFTWLPGWTVAVVVPVGAVVLLVASGAGSPGAEVAGAGAGLLLLVVVVLLDLAEQARRASPAVVRRALRRLVPGLAAGAAAGAVVAGAGILGSGIRGGTVLAATAPWVLLVAVLLALGTATRRERWSMPAAEQLSVTTRRYLERARRTEDELR